MRRIYVPTHVPAGAALGLLLLAVPGMTILPGLSLRRGDGPFDAEWYPRADLGYANLIDADLVDVDLSGAKLGSVSLDGARIVRGTFADAAMPLARLTRVVIDRTTFDGTNLLRSSWRDAKVNDGRFIATTLASAKPRSA